MLDAAHAALPWAAEAAGAARRVVVHGDLYARHVVVEAGRLVGFIDWGDVHLGDPALDLSIAHALLPPDAHGAFRVAYGDVDRATWARARFRAAHYVSALLHYGWDVDDADLVAEAQVALRHLEATHR
ncbi:MAG: phosphotransferase [Myxococcales bacterium]|nr:phosphotransferase [Myxococcales bacterium]